MIFRVDKYQEQTIRRGARVIGKNLIKLNQNGKLSCQHKEEAYAEYASSFFFYSGVFSTGCYTKGNSHLNSKSIIRSRNEIKMHSLFRNDS